MQKRRVLCCNSEFRLRNLSTCFNLQCLPAHALVPTCRNSSTVRKAVHLTSVPLRLRPRVYKHAKTCNSSIMGVGKALFHWQMPQTSTNSVPICLCSPFPQRSCSAPGDRHPHRLCKARTPLSCHHKASARRTLCSTSHRSYRNCG